MHLAFSKGFVYFNAFLLLSVLSTELGIPSQNLLAIMRDCASINNVAVTTLSIMYPSVLDTGCFSHTLNHVGEKFKVPTLEKFMKHWEQMFKHSYKSRLMWHETQPKSCQYPKVPKFVYC